MGVVDATDPEDAAEVFRSAFRFRLWKRMIERNRINRMNALIKSV